MKSETIVQNCITIFHLRSYDFKEGGVTGDQATNLLLRQTSPNSHSFVKKTFISDVSASN